MTKLVLVAFLSIVGLNLAIASDYLTKSTRPTEYYGTDLSTKEAKEAKKLTHHFDDLSKALEQKLPGNTDLKANLVAAKEMLSSSRLTLTMGWKKAYELFVSLENTVGGKCDLESYEILAKNYAAIHPDDDKSKSNSRAADVLSYYQLEHANECGQKYKEIYKKKIEVINKDQLEMLKSDFSGLKVVHFGYWTQPGRLMSLASIPRVDFNSDSLSHLAINIGIQAWIASPGGGVRKLNPIYHEESRLKAVNRYLIEPCESYRNQLNEALSPARFDAKTNVEILGDDWEFTDAIVYNRMCGNLLEKKEKISEILVEYLHEELPIIYGRFVKLVGREATSRDWLNEYTATLEMG